MGLISKMRLGRGDDRGPSIVDRVPEAASVVVARVVRRDDLAGGSAQLVEVARGKSGGRVGHRSPPGGFGVGSAFQYAASRSRYPAGADSSGRSEGAAISATIR